MRRARLTPPRMINDPAPRKESYIPARLGDLLAALSADGAPASLAEIARLIAAIFHYEAHAKLEQLRDLYFPLDPDRPVAAAAMTADPDKALPAFETALAAILTAGNFNELPFEALGASAKAHVLNDLRVKTSDAGIKRIRFFSRGEHAETVTRRVMLRTQSVEAEVLADVVLLVAFEAPRGKRSAAHIRPGTVLLKHFRNVARHELAALHPGARPTMKRRDQAMLGLPALAGGAPLLIQLGSAIPVIFAVAAAYFGAQGVIDDSSMKKALAALSGVVALGGFMMRQWVKYQRQSLLYQKKLSDTVYFHNAANNSGVLYMLIAAGEEQDVKEAAVAYHVLLKHGAMAKDALDAACEALLREKLGAAVDFEIQDALGKLLRLKLVTQDGETIRATPVDAALVALDAAWDGIFQYAKSA
jgi:Protein of unknown function (DUF3754)